MRNNASLTAIIASYNSAAVISDCILALRDDAHVIVVDNASSDDTAGIAQKLGVQVICNDLNEGYGRANNIGARMAASEFLLFINPDAIMPPGGIAAMLEAARNNPQAGIMAPALVEGEGKRSCIRPGLLGEHFSGACILIRRDLFERMGGFDENIFLFFEDNDLCRRIQDAGHALVPIETVTVGHRLGGSSKKHPDSQYISRYYQAWSRFYVARKYGIKESASRWLFRFSVKYAWAAIKQNKERRARYAGSLCGMLDFVRGRMAFEGPSHRQKRNRSDDKSTVPFLVSILLVTTLFWWAATLIPNDRYPPGNPDWVRESLAVAASYTRP